VHGSQAGCRWCVWAASRHVAELVPNGGTDLQRLKPSPVLKYSTLEDL
jgi:hypothetical protein